MTENYREIIKNNNFRFENYKLACKELDEKVKTGKSKLLQLDEWNRHFAFHKESNAIVIDAIRDTPLPKINKRNGDCIRIISQRYFGLTVILLAQ